MLIKDDYKDITLSRLCYYIYIYIYIFEILENYLSKQLVEVIVAPFERNVSYTRNVFDK